MKHFLTGACLCLRHKRTLAHVTSCAMLNPSETSQQGHEETTLETTFVNLCVRSEKPRIGQRNAISNCRFRRNLFSCATRMETATMQDGGILCWLHRANASFSCQLGGPLTSTQCETFPSCHCPIQFPTQYFTIVPQGAT